ncbi:siderophore-interacting protein [Rhizobium sp. SL86]|uniref:siderophore-interacting protein n=1 Tax=Rhizobium sp. SL86 TaxID=2995148 RepID=UPI0022761898|nr:siderophore-interacting protein [Rhizobium sp. SL86]MCY1666706.1 siderophore-interacting protein [Rhizobium sp. SL86]
MQRAANRTYRASSTVRFERIGDYTEAFIDSIATHDMAVEVVKGVYQIRSPFGHATFEALEAGFRLTAEAPEAGALNRLKHALAGPIGFIAARERIEISWEGDQAEPTLPDDLRILTVRHVTDVAPCMRRVVFSGKDLGRYDRIDQMHCRLIFQPRGVTQPVWPMLDHRGQVVWPGKAVPTRVYTIRRIDAAAGELAIDFALHGDPGPATRWALDVRPGDMVGVLGPAAHGPKPSDFLVLLGDETALPGIARIIEGLPASTTGHVMIEVDGAEDELPLICPPRLNLRWLHRDGAAPGTTTLLVDAVRSVAWPEDLHHCFFWGGCEHAAFSAIYRHLKREVGLPRDRFVFYSHWHRLLSEEDIIATGGEAYLPDPR